MSPTREASKVRETRQMTCTSYECMEKNGHPLKQKYVDSRSYGTKKLEGITFDKHLLI